MGQESEHEFEGVKEIQAPNVFEYNNLGFSSSPKTNKKISEKAVIQISHPNYNQEKFDTQYGYRKPEKVPGRLLEYYRSQSIDEEYNYSFETVSEQLLHENAQAIFLANFSDICVAIIL
jgi:hypothetical protein